MSATPTPIPSDTSPVIRARASVLKVHDGDTYLMLLDLHGRGLEEDGCDTVWVRLRNVSARELTDKAPTDPQNLGRVDGPAAQQLAVKALLAATALTVELQGPAGPAGDSFGRLVGTVYADGQSLGALLAAQNAVAPGAFEGASEAGWRATLPLSIDITHHPSRGHRRN